MLVTVLVGFSSQNYAQPPTGPAGSAAESSGRSNVSARREQADDPLVRIQSRIVNARPWRPMEPAPRMPSAWLRAAEEALEALRGQQATRLVPTPGPSEASRPSTDKGLDDGTGTLSVIERYIAEEIPWTVVMPEPGLPEPSILDALVPLFPDHAPDGGSQALVEAQCARIAAVLQSITRQDCLDAGLRVSEHRSAGGHPLLGVELKSVNSTYSQARVLLLGGVHGDELTSVAAVFEWLKALRKSRPGIFHWVVVPLVNPDGFLSEPRSRTNGNGVDLNRNLPTPQWESHALEWWSTRAHKNPRRYPGPGPGSEPETRFVIDIIERFRPESVLSVHAPLTMVDFDYSRDGIDGPRRLGDLPLKDFGVYPGSLGNYSGFFKSIPTATVELEHALEMPSDDHMFRIWRDTLAWLSKNVYRDKIRLSEEVVGNQTARQTAH